MRILTACLAFGFVIVYAGLAPAEVIYRELYTTQTQGDLSTLAGWNSREGTNAAPLVSGLDITAPVIGGPNPNLSAVNSNPATGTIGRTLQRALSGPFITYTSEYAIDLALNSLTELRLWESNSRYNESTKTNDTFRLAVEIGGTWRVTDQASALTGLSQNTGDGIWSEQSLNLATATWSSLTFTPGSSLSAPGAASPLPGTGTITAFGLYRPSVFVNGSDFRLDSVELSAVPVPEPSSVAMLLFGGVVLRLVGRKRRA